MYKARLIKFDLAGAAPELTAADNRVSDTYTPYHQLISYRELETRKSFQKIHHRLHLKKTETFITNTISCLLIL